MGRRDRRDESLGVIWVPNDALAPNPWNPNRMDAEMFAKERASIRTFGFIDPLTVRVLETGSYQIIDGEHRWQAGIAEGIESFPCIVLDVDEDSAKELTIILNDTRGTMQQDRLSALVKDLAERREQVRLDGLLPYDRKRMGELLDRREIDWDQIEERRQELSKKSGGEEPWVERIFRMPRSAAGVVDEAIQQVKADEEVDQDWRALELIAADFLGK